MKTLCGLLLFCASIAHGAEAPALKDGFYCLDLVKKRDDQVHLALPGDSDAWVDRPLQRKEYVAMIVSDSNDNDRFDIDLKMPWDSLVSIALVVDGRLVVATDGNYGYSFSNVDLKVADSVARWSKARIVRRARPDYQVSARFLVDKKVYKLGEPIFLKVEVRNWGKTTAHLSADDRGDEDRSGLLEIWPSWHTLLTDGKDGLKPIGSGGSAVHWPVSVPPGKTFTAIKDRVDWWFKPIKPGVYYFTAVAQIEYYDKSSGRPQVLWEDHVGGKFQFEVK